MSKSASLSADLIATKGAAAPVEDMPVRSPALAKKSEAVIPLNFRVTAEFRRAFKTYAAEHDLKLSELLVLAFEAYRQGSLIPEP